MHARKPARDALFPKKADDGFFAPRRGDIVFRDAASVRAFADRVNRGENRPEAMKLHPSELGAMAFLHEVLHAVVARYREAHPEAFRELAAALDEALGGSARVVLEAFVAHFPPVAVYRHFRGEKGYERLTPKRYLDLAEPEVLLELEEEIILLWMTNQNPAYQRVRSIVSDEELGAPYEVFVEHARKFFAEAAPFGPRGESLFDLLLAPSKQGGSIMEQLAYVETTLGPELGVDALPFWTEKQRVHDLVAEEGKFFLRGGPGPGEPLMEAMRFGPRDEDLPPNFSPDLNWMPNVVLVAKSVYVWLDQLSKKYDKEIRRLDQIPDEELDVLRSQQFTGLWLIGLFERSHASRKVKQMRGDHDALASAYSLHSYDIAQELGGYAGWENLRDRAWRRGLRLAADMVPNHVGIDAQWVVNHPDWFIQTPLPPYPGYRFGGPDLSEDPNVGVWLEEGYWNMTDAAVVFRRLDRRTGEERFIYHGNDGTSMPWNDTAQLDYLKAEVRHAVIETILHVARMFPIIRFDAAMTLAKRHVQRLWYPLPGNGGEAIPSRADFAMTQETFDALTPIEFWREVVDTVAVRAPDTLLLAEAFWMMEGYFVRTLGMHRVYNSAFMNMMKREENEKYKATITNVLDFDPEILKRFVNFMNNPDEETAISQFGANEKYFGVAAMMSTMPGLPMFGHGQVDGLREKYGMEYRRARFDERPNPYVITRHEREIFPLLQKRYLFSGVEHFALYDFMVDGRPDHDVFAYSNGAGSERALVLFNNRSKTTRGRVQFSTHRGSLGRELDLDEDRGWWVAFRDVPHGLEYLRPVADVIAGGMIWELEGYQYHVLMSFRQMHATLERPYDRLAMELNGRGVPDIDQAVRELYLRPIHAPLREACSTGHLAYLAQQLLEIDDIAPRAALAERLGHVVDGLDWMLTQRSHRDITIFRDPAIERAGDRFTAIHGFVRISRVDAAAAVDAAEDDVVAAVEEPVVPLTDDAAAAEEPVEADVAPEIVERELHLDLLIASLQLEAVIELLAAGADALEIARAKPPEYLTAGAIVFRPEPRRPSSLPSMPAIEPDFSLEATAEARAPQALDHASEPPVEALPVTPDFDPEPEPDLALDPDGAPDSWTGLSWATRESLLEEWALATPILEAFGNASSAALVMLAATLPTGPLTPAVRLAVGTKRGQTFLDVHESGGVYWLNKERFEELVRFLAERESASGRLHLADAATEAQALVATAATEGYRADKIAWELGAPPNVDIPERRTQRPPASAAPAPALAAKEEAPEGEAADDGDEKREPEQKPDDA